MEARGLSGSSVSDQDNQVNSHPSSSSNDVVDEKHSTATEPPPADGRIPSHVFTPTNTNSLAEWSVASNESLFSIPVGNMSFNDNFSWMSKSGELDPTIISSPLFEFPIKPSTPTEGSTENYNNRSYSLKSDEDDEDGYGTVNEVASKTMREVLKEKEDHQQKNKIPKEPDHLSRSMSQSSDTSCKSFAFPILTAEADKNDTSKRGSKNRKQSSSRPSTAQNTPPETPKPLRVPETPKAETPKSSTPKGTQNGGTKRWFSCFSCFPSCS